MASHTNGTLVESYEGRVYRPGVMRSTVNNSKSRAYQRAIAKNLESQRRLDFKYENIDYDMQRARSCMNSEIYQLKAELYRIRSKTPTLEEFRQGKTIAGVDNFQKEVAALSNDYYEIVNGKVTRKSAVSTTTPGARPDTSASAHSRSASRGSRPTTGKGRGRPAPTLPTKVHLIPLYPIHSVDSKTEGQTENVGNKADYKPFVESQAAAPKLLPADETGENDNDIPEPFSGKQIEAKVQDGNETSSEGSRADSPLPERDKELDQLLGRATKEDILKQARNAYAMSAFEDVDSDMSDDELSGTKQARGKSAPAKVQQDTGRRDPRKPHVAKSASLATRSRRVRSRKGLTPRSSHSPTRYEPPALDPETLMNPLVNSGNPYQDLFKPEMVTVQRVVRMSVISRKLHEIEANRDREFDGGSPPPKISVAKMSDAKSKGSPKGKERRVRYTDVKSKFTKS